MTDRMRILIQTVGTGGDDHPVWKSMAKVAQELEPDILWHVCSKLTRNKTIPKFDSEVGSEFSTDREYLVLQDEDDFAKILGEVCNLIDVLREQYPNAEISGDFTSGTKPMSSGLVAAFTAYDIGPLLYGKGQRDESGRSTKTDYIINTPTAAAAAAGGRSRIGKLFDACQFEAVIEFCDFIIHKATESKGVVPEDFSRIRKMALMAQHWDRYEWELAKKNSPQPPHVSQNENDVLQSIAKLSDDGWRKVEIDGVQRHLAQCACNNKPFSTNRVADMLANAKRRLAEGRYDDTVARLYRLLEFIGQARFLTLRATQIPSIDTSNPTSQVCFTWLRDHAPKWAERNAPVAPNKMDTGQGSAENKKLGLHDTWDVLWETGDTVATHVHGLLVQDDGRPGELHSLLQSRNNSLLAHGSRPVTELKAKKLFKLLTEVTKLHLEEAFESLIAAATFPVCPWAPSSATLTPQLEVTAS